MLRRLWERRRAAAALRRLAVFSGIPRSELATADRRLSEISVPAGRVVVRQGEPGLDFAVIVEGTAEVTRDGRTIAHLASGDFFGEMALLGDSPRTASVAATTPMRLLVATRAEFGALLEQASTIRARVRRAAARRGTDHSEREPARAA